MPKQINKYGGELPTEIEKMFYETFNIETVKFYRGTYIDGDLFKEEYPLITDKILLALIDVIIQRDFDVLKLYKFQNSYHAQFDTTTGRYFVNYQQNNLRDLILEILIGNKEIFYDKVHEAFKERN